MKTLRVAKIYSNLVQILFFTLKNTKKKPALQEKEGISPPDSIGAAAVEKLKSVRKNRPAAGALAARIITGDTVALSRAITLIESTRKQHTEDAQTIIETCLPYAGKSVRIGITGVPGVGKSTFIEVFGKFLTARGKKVAVLAVDPSSAISKGSILGDKTRMDALAKDEHAFIRPSPSGETLGGVARKTRETVLLCEACGFDIIIIETVGVGQSETAVHGMTDFFLLLKLAGAGDELQGIKRGIMEAADAVVIHKADGDTLKAARQAKTDFSRALHLYPPKENGWMPKVLLASALEHSGIEAIWELIAEYIRQNRENGFFDRRRVRQNKHWFLQTVEERLKTDFYGHPAVEAELKTLLKAVENNEMSPFAAAQRLFLVYTA
ncbi:MAG: methylmalonyl Co-A mutase-associated GTPase MeaB [Sinomicrobium sp.]|nr:methylmalonyl Co-A mutase-associated GTPase MeaB [Sinomicrobium sp.]